MAATILRARVIVTALARALIAALAPLAMSPPAFAGPVADSDEAYLLCGPVLPARTGGGSSSGAVILIRYSGDRSSSPVVAADAWAAAGPALS